METPCVETTGKSEASTQSSGVAEAPRIKALTFSSMSAFQRCPREYQLSYVERLAPAQYAPALTLGAAFHAGIGALHVGRQFDEAIAVAEAAIDRDVDRALQMASDGEGVRLAEAAARDKAKMSAMLTGWFGRHFAVWNGTAAARDRDIEMIESEIVLEAQLVNPTSGRPSRTFTMAGRLDGIVRLREAPDGSDPTGIWVLEAKTTSDEINEAAESLALSIQPNLYEVLAAGYFGPQLGPVLGSVLDIVKKPVIRGRAGEPMGAYRARAVEAYSAEPDRFFRRIILPADDRRRRAAMAAAWGVARTIRDAGKYGFVGKQGPACRGPYGPCKFQPVCWHNDRSGFIEKQDTHEELGRVG
ncbi:MAG: PD-(D/E)XK nuclease family protein [Acidobacteria bacterium]|nr:PD-(D/E)XK nuclease family protein [Acidobacteriota bacterium]